MTIIDDMALHWLLRRPVPHDLYTLEQVAEYLQVSRKTVDRMVRSGALSVVTLPGRGTRPVVRVRRSDLEALGAKKAPEGNSGAVPRTKVTKPPAAAPRGGFRFVDPPDTP
jgi:excisionase family DNA binding protein